MNENAIHKMSNYTVVQLNDSLTKSVYTKEVLQKLPEWFGNKQALDDYIKKVAELPFWAPLNKDKNCVGFFTVKTHYDRTGDVFVCGVLPEYHRNGIGKALYTTAEAYLIKTAVNTLS